MARGDVILDAGADGAEKSPVYGTMTLSGGTETLSAGTFTLYDDAGAVISAFNAVAITDHTGDGTALLTFWYLLNTAGLADGYYTAIFWITLATSDGLTRKKPVIVDVYVRAAP